MTERTSFIGLEYGFEGIDGGGKTSSIGYLTEHYQNRGLEVVVLSGLSKTPFGMAIRRNIVKLNEMGIEGMRFFKEDIRRSYESVDGRGDTADLIFWDRHIYSMAAANIRGCDLGLIRETNPQVHEPSKVFLLDVPPNTAWERECKAQKGDHPLTPQWLEEKCDRYRQLASMEPDRFIVIDASRPFDDVTAQLLDIINEDLRKVPKNI
jgi:dTMP kinase